MGSRGDSYDNALAETIIGLYKAEPWNDLEDVELATLEWVWWFNHHHLLSSIGRGPPAGYEENFHSHHSPHRRAVALT